MYMDTKLQQIWDICNRATSVGASAQTAGTSGTACHDANNRRTCNEPLIVSRDEEGPSRLNNKHMHWDLNECCNTAQ